MSVAEMLRTHPLSASQGETTARCIEECIACAQDCTVCADACLAESEPADLRRCIALNLDCADMCRTTASVLSRSNAADGELIRSVLLACIQACRSCGQECEQHAQHHDHCRICAESCHRCGKACEEAVTALGTV